MGRPGLTYSEVAKAAEALSLQGKNPTVNSVRDYLQTGSSSSTIGPHLKQWKSRQEGKLAGGNEGLPADLLNIVKSLYEHIQTEAEQKVTTAQQEFDQKKADIEHQLKEAHRALHELGTSKEALENELKELSQVKQEQEQAFNETREILAKTETQRDEASSRVSELKETIHELKQENQNVREHLEHYQQTVAQERQTERDQARQLQQQLQNQVMTLESQLLRSQNQYSDLFQTHSEAQQEIVTLKQMTTELQLRHDHKDHEIAKLENEANTAATINQSIVSERDELLETLTAANLEKDRIYNREMHLSQKLQTMQDAFQAAQDKIAKLSDDKTSLIHEKAMALGQLKQLQDYPLKKL